MGGAKWTFVSAVAVVSVGAAVAFYYAVGRLHCGGDAAYPDGTCPRAPDLRHVAPPIEEAVVRGGQDFVVDPCWELANEGSDRAYRCLQSRPHLQFSGVTAQEWADRRTRLSREVAKVEQETARAADISVPKTAISGQPFKVYLRVKSVDVEKLIDPPAIQGDNKPLGGVDLPWARNRVLLTRVMSVMVQGVGFEVLPAAGYSQSLLPGETTWSFQVEPKRDGPLHLQFKLTGLLDIEGKKTGRVYLDRTVDIDVARGWLELVQQHWQWLATALALPAIGALWALRRRRMREARSVPKR